MNKRSFTKELPLKMKGDCKEAIKSLLLTFLEEEPEANYKYYVEKLSDGRKIYIKRPTRRMNFDFEIWIEDPRGEYKPKHDDIINELINIKKADKQAFSKLMELIDKVYRCEDPDELLRIHAYEIKEYNRVEYILKVLKWMFLLEDIYYWSYKRREKLIEYIKSRVYQNTLFS